MCPCYGWRIHYPMLEKPGAQNIAAYENQGNNSNIVITENQ